MSIFKEPKIDCHAHVFDPVNFPYGKDIEYKPAGQEMGTPEQYAQVMKTYGVGYALLVQPNSGYGSDNRCLLDTIAKDRERLKGISIVELDADSATLRNLKQQGIVGAAFNPTFHGIDYYRKSEPLIARLAELDMFLNLQCEHDQLALFVPWIEKLPIKVLIDHCGRPTPEAGLDQAGFAALMRIAGTDRVSVKLSGYSKFARRPYPFADAWPYVRSIVDAYTLDRCMWASDWPYLRAPQRQDYGPLVELAETLFPHENDRRKLYWDTPKRLFSF